MPNTNMLENILFYGRQIITVPSGEEDNSIFAGTALKNLSDYGFTLDEEGVNLLSTASKEDIQNWYYDTVKKLNEITGGVHIYRPFYPNFPEQVMEASELQLFIEQIAHYWVGYMPNGENAKENIRSIEEHPLKVLTTIDEKDEEDIYNKATEVFKNTLKSKQTPSESDIKNIINPYINAVNNWTAEASVVENRLVLSYLYTKALNEHKNVNNMPKLVTNDYLRIARTVSYMKENNVEELSNLSAINSQRLTSIPRSVRKFMAEGLEFQKNLEEDISRDKNTWKVAFRLMHIGEYKEYTKVNDIAFKLRNNQRLETYYSKIERAFAEKDYEKLLKLYSQRPGEMIKNMNRLLTLDVKEEEKQSYAKKLIETSKDVFKKVRPEDLINFMEYIKSRTREDRVSIHNVNGKFVQSENKYEVIPKHAAELITNIAKNAVAEQIYTGKSYGAVYLDPNMRKMVLPKDIKDSSENMNRYPKGSSLPLEKNEDDTPKNIRAFIWWTNMENGARVDVDLSANFYRVVDNEEKAHLEYVDALSYHTHYRSFNCVHSGDITNGGDFGGQGVCEYVDLDIKSLKDAGIDYVQIFVNAYTGNSFSEIPCEAGWQERDELDVSKQFDIKAVKQHSSLSGDAKGTTPFILDVNKGEIIWTDTPDFYVQACSNSINAIKSIDCIMERYCKNDRMTMEEMVNLAVATNGGYFVDSPEEADIIFSVNAYEGKTENQRVITSKDQDVWLGEFMSPQIVEDENEKSEIQTNNNPAKTERSLLDIIDALPDENVEKEEIEVLEEQMLEDFEI